VYYLRFLSILTTLRLRIQLYLETPFLTSGVNHVRLLHVTWPELSRSCRRRPSLVGDNISGRLELSNDLGPSWYLIHSSPHLLLSLAQRLRPTHPFHRRPIRHRCWEIESPSRFGLRSGVAFARVSMSHAEERSYMATSTS
jgi:hypothetical protein